MKENTGYIDLHVHLDGSLSIDTVKKLAEMQGIDTGADDDEQLKRRLQVSSGCRDLNEYLTKFDFPLELLQTPEALELAVYELMKLQESQGLIYSEIRFAPQLHTRKAMTQRDAAEAALCGRQRFLAENGFVSGETDCGCAGMTQEGGKKQSGGLFGNLILCCMRGENNDKQNFETLDIAADFFDPEGGVTAVDLAGAEGLYPTGGYKKLFERASQLGLPFTIHAGEAAGADSVRMAVEFGAKRIGHGINAVKDKELLRELASEGVTLELCPTSNLNTRVVDNISDYPVCKLIAAGVKTTINTDNMTVSNTNIGKEFGLICDTFGYDEEMRRQFLLNSAEAAFASDKIKKRLALELFATSRSEMRIV